MENIELLFKSYFSEIKLMDRTLPKYLYNDFFPHKAFSSGESRCCGCRLEHFCEQLSCVPNRTKDWYLESLTAPENICIHRRIADE